MRWAEHTEASSIRWAKRCCSSFGGAQPGQPIQNTSWSGEHCDVCCGYPWAHFLLEKSTSSFKQSQSIAYPMSTHHCFFHNPRQPTILIALNATPQRRSKASGGPAFHTIEQLQTSTAFPSQCFTCKEHNESQGLPMERERKTSYNFTLLAMACGLQW